MKNVNKKLEETIQRVATNTIGYTKKQANEEWSSKGEQGMNENQRTSHPK
jgi:hypothetical protein